MNIFALEKQNLQPITWEKDNEVTGNLSIDVRSSIHFYNAAVEKIINNDDSEAITDLKKALSLNSEFYEALKLLGICYVTLGKYDLAEKAFKKLTKNKLYAEHAIVYRENLKVLAKSRRPKMTWLPGVVLIILGVFLIFAGTRVYMLHQETFSLKTQAANLQKQATSSLEALTGKFDQEQVKNSHLQEEYQKVSNDLNQITFKYDILKKLLTVESLYAAGQYSEASDLLVSLPPDGMEDAAKTQYEQIKNKLSQKTFWASYQQGNNFYKQGKYDEALPVLEKIVPFNPDPQLMPWHLFQVAFCLNKTGDNERCKEYLNRVRNEYGDTNYAVYSERLLNEINQN